MKGNEKDEFDDRSHFIVIRQFGELVGYGRLTPGPNSVFYTWTNGKGEIPNSEQSIDLGRCMLYPKFRGHDFLRVICIVGFVIAKKLRYEYINGASLPGRGLISLLEEIGYEKSGNIVNLYDPLGAIVPIQLFTCNLNSNKANLPMMLSQQCEKLLANGIELELNIE